MVKEASVAARTAKETARVNRDRAVYGAGGGDAARKEREKNTNGNRGFFGRKGGGGEAAYETRKQGEDNLFKAGGGNAATKGGLTRQQIIDKGIQATSKKTETPNTKPAQTETPNTSQHKQQHKQSQHKQQHKQSQHKQHRKLLLLLLLKTVWLAHPRLIEWVLGLKLIQN